MNKTNSQEQPDPSFSTDDEDQLLRYAKELTRLHEVERAERDLLSRTQTALVQAQAQQQTIAEDLRRSMDAERKLRQEAYDAPLTAFKLIVAATEQRDPRHTAGHAERVTKQALALTTYLKLPKNAHRRVEIGAALHDLGKAGIPDAALTHPTGLSHGETLLYKQHTSTGADMLRRFLLLSPGADVLAGHHEHWDGSGYPLGLSGEAISLESRIVAVICALDSILEQRPPTQQSHIDEAWVVLSSYAGSRLDPQLVDAAYAAWTAGAYPLDLPPTAATTARISR